MKHIADKMVVDLHCDTLTQAYHKGISLCNKSLHWSLDRIPRRYRLGQAMAIFIPDTLRGAAAEEYFECSRQVLWRDAGIYPDCLCVLGDLACLKEAMQTHPVTAFLTVEGGAVLSGKLENVDRLYGLGVRMLTLTWNAANELCGGADTDLGFTAFGRQAVQRMEQVGMAVDVSHISDRGFWELCEFAKRPFLASHSNARAVCAHRRNLTDAMFLEIVRRGGVVGLNYYVRFLQPDGTPKTTGIDDVLRHLHHFLALGGEDAVALGSDYDGAEVPNQLAGIQTLDALYRAVERSGIPSRVVEKLFFQNASRFLAQACKPLPVECTKQEIKMAEYQ